MRARRSPMSRRSSAHGGSAAAVRRTWRAAHSSPASASGSGGSGRPAPGRSRSSSEPRRSPIARSSRPFADRGCAVGFSWVGTAATRLRQPLDDRPTRRHRYRGRDERDAVLPRELWPPRDIDRDDRATTSAELLLECVAIRAERVRELDHDVTGEPAGTELGEIDRVDAPRTDPTKASRHPVHLAAHAEAGRRREKRERRDDEAENRADDREPKEIRERRRSEEEGADLVREPWRTAVLDRTLADAWLEHLEVEEAREAVPPPESETDRELTGEQAEDGPPTGEDGDERERPDDRLIRPRGSRVDHVRVAIGIRRALHGCPPNSECSARNSWAGHAERRGEAARGV